jgi:hypothetical protein
MARADPVSRQDATVERGPGRIGSRADVRRLHDDLLDEATSLRQSGQARASVVIAMTAVEVCLARALRACFEDRGLPPEAADAVIPKPSTLADKLTRRLWTALTGDKLGKSVTWWVGYDRSAQRRNRVVHAGEDASADDADIAIASARQATDHIVTTLEALGIDHRLGSGTSDRDEAGAT